MIAAANRHGKPIRTEIDLAYEWEQQRTGGPRPMLAVTGTDGKTTTTMMAAAMLRCAGLKAAAVGNTELPLVAALDTDVDAFVVECSSFRLNWIDHFRSEASVWLNLAAGPPELARVDGGLRAAPRRGCGATTGRPMSPSATPPTRS